MVFSGGGGTEVAVVVEGPAVVERAVVVLDVGVVIESEGKDDDEESGETSNSPVAHICLRLAKIGLTWSDDFDFVRGCFLWRFTLVCWDRSDAKSADADALLLFLLIERSTTNNHLNI